MLMLTYIKLLNTQYLLQNLGYILMISFQFITRFVIAIFRKFSTKYQTHLNDFISHIHFSVNFQYFYIVWWVLHGRPPPSRPSSISHTVRPISYRHKSIYINFECNMQFVQSKECHKQLEIK